MFGVGFIVAVDAEQDLKKTGKSHISIWVRIFEQIQKPGQRSGTQSFLTDRRSHKKAGVIGME